MLALRLQLLFTMYCLWLAGGFLTLDAK